MFAWVTICLVSAVSPLPAADPFELELQSILHRLPPHSVIQARCDFARARLNFMCQEASLGGYTADKVWGFNLQYSVWDMYDELRLATREGACWPLTHLEKADAYLQKWGLDFDHLPPP